MDDYVEVINDVIFTDCKLAGAGKLLQILEILDKVLKMYEFKP